MQRVGGFSANLRPPWWSIACVSLCAALASRVWFGDEGGAEPFRLALPLALGIVAAAAAAAGVQARMVAERQRLEDAVREARGRLRCLDDVLDLWQWRTDAAHRVVELRPPANAAVPAWRTPPQPLELWQLFQCTDDAALKARMVRGAALDDIDVSRVGSAEPWRGVLRGRAFHDALGGFAGYHGTLRELPAVAAATAPATSLPVPVADPLGTEQESFSYTVSHDLRAPIRVVEGFTKIVKEDYGRLLDRVGNDHLDRVLGAAARMNNMIDALLALSRLATQPLARQPVNLSQLAGYVADDLRRQSPERNVALTIEPGIRIHGDPTLLRVVLENLLGNAWKYTAKSAQAQVHFERNPNAADTFTVRDNGAGFDMRFADRLFGVFQRLHSANDFAGTGIGLASVRRIVRRHGGEIWGEAEVNRGARFHFSLPQAPGWASPTTPLPDAAPLRPTAQTGFPASPPPSMVRGGDAVVPPPRSQGGGTPASSASSSRSA